MTEENPNDQDLTSGNFGNEKVKIVKPDKGRVYCPACGESAKLLTTSGVLEERGDLFKALRCADCNEDFYLDISDLVQQMHQAQYVEENQAQTIPMKKSKLEKHWSIDKKVKKLKKYDRCMFWVIERYCENKGYPWCSEHLELMRKQGITPPPTP